MKWILMLMTLLALSSCASHGNFGKMDTNGDGAVSKAEFTAHADAKFSKYDKDGNGTIDAAEMPKCSKKKKCHKKKGDCKSGKCATKTSCCKDGKCSMKDKGCCKGGKCKMKKHHKQTDCKDGSCQLHSKDKSA